MPAVQDLTGQRFGRLVALTKVRSRGKKTFWLWRCDCGTEKECQTSHVKGLKIRSCGCMLEEYLHSEEHAASCARASRLPRTHGMSNEPEYFVWKSMRQRCENEKSHDYRWYGALGVRVCERWQKFENFYADMGKSNGLTLDRIDPAKDYSPENCRWASWEVQRTNKRKHQMVTA